ncbi:MAG TPA: hypothetical protein VIS74_08605 [Chthoniobacterales bacterium]
MPAAIEFITSQSPALSSLQEATERGLSLKENCGADLFAKPVPGFSADFGVQARAGNPDFFAHLGFKAFGEIARGRGAFIFPGEAKTEQLRVVEADLLVHGAIHSPWWRFVNPKTGSDLMNRALFRP